MGASCAVTWSISHRERFRAAPDYPLRRLNTDMRLIRSRMGQLKFSSRPWMGRRPEPKAEVFRARINLRFLSGGWGQQGGAAPDKGGEMAGVVVWSVVFPTAPEDAHPLEAEGAQDGMVAFACVFLTEAMLFGPCAAWHRLTRPLHQGLAQELRCGPAPMHPQPALAIFAHRCDPGLFFLRSRVRVAIGPFAEEREEARGEHRTGSG